MSAGRLARSPQYGYSLAQLARFGFRVSEQFFFVLFGIIRLQETFDKKIRAGRLARSPQ
jgi:hypothetical protein